MNLLRSIQSRMILLRYCKDLLDSKLFADYSKFKALHEITKGDNKNVNNSDNSTVCTFSKDFKGTGEKIEEDTHNENQNKIEQKKPKFLPKIVNEEPIITKCIEEEQEINIISYPPIKKRKVKVNEFGLCENENDISVYIFQALYEKYTLFKISEMNKLALSFRLSDEKYKSFMKELVCARVKIPDIKRVVIIDAKDANSDIKKFFEYCIPANIQYLCVNHYASSNNQIHMKYYINSFLKSIKSVSKEVFIEFFLLTASDLQQIVKASHHVERLVFKSCTIRCSGTLNFKSKSKPKMSFMSFANCSQGNANSDFRTNPSCFKNIVDAIAKSGLKKSLKKINICKCSLDKKEVLKMFRKHEMGLTEVSEIEIYPSLY